MVLITNNSLKLASIKYISKAVYSKYLRGFYKYLQYLKKNSGELLRSVHCTWHQNALLSLPCDMDQWPAESVPALMENLCRCTQDGVTHISELRVGCWEQGGWATHDARRAGVGNLCHSTSSCHWTHDKTQGSSLRENSSSHEWERLGKGGQIRELETMPCVIYPVPSCSQGFCATIQAYMWTIYLTWNLPFLPF